MNKIEELLKKQPKPILNDAQKGRLFARVLEKERAMHKPSLLEHIRSWRLMPIFSIATLTAIVVILWYPTDAVNRNEEVQLAQYKGNIQVNSVNENTGPVPPHISSALSIEAYILGTGGSSMARTWTFEVHEDVLAVSQPFPSAAVLRPLDADTLTEVAQAFGYRLEDLRVRTLPQETMIYTTLPKKAQSSLCAEERILTDAIVDERCFSVSTRGVISMEQSVAEAQEDGMTEAFEYITALTGQPQDHWIVSPVSQSAIQSLKQTKQYAISLKNEPVYTGTAWHIVLSGNALISIVGSIAAFDVDAAGSDADVVSAAVAIDRLKTDFNHTQFEPARSVVGFYVDPFHNSQLSARRKVDIDIRTVRLESALFDTSIDSTQGNTSIYQLPVYRITGVEKGTERAVEFLVDASLKGNMIDLRYRFISHPLQLMSL